ncbi:probable glucuronoxylan glucuronosyltransferase F8H [Zingiber officinale]|uniref:probable glucuronoxylan glucuronosyltransferase F8H n=1 Tax=Zingiber officinale TaxID=94328 RepID=UPI001C4D4702|nr:probable glucuronoxylan glucuronosyltransferase F8H [Zingiber officinale]
MARRTQAPHHTHKVLSFKKHYKWLLWFSLSIYFFLYTTSSSSFLFLHPLRLNPDLPGRALIESKTPPFHSSLPTVYIYELPSRLNTDWLANEQCRTHFAAEVAIHEALLQYSSCVLDSEEADFFFLLVYVSCNFSTINGFPDFHHACPLLVKAVELIPGGFPFWNRSRGRDHVFAASHDYGACFHAM